MRKERKAAILGAVLTALVALLFVVAAWWQGVLPVIGGN